MNSDNKTIKIDRRTFLMKTANCSACLTFLPLQGALANEFAPVVDKNDTKKIFIKKGTCSQTFYYLLNREFEHNKEDEERAVDPLAGGIMQKGYQCGMLWGASLAVGAESYRRNQNQGIAINQTIITTQLLIESFINKTNTPDCRDITNIDFSKRFSILKMLFFKTGDCFRLAEKWTPKAIKAANEGLSITGQETKALSCATEVAKRMNASDEEMITVSGFAGGLGLSGNACGALSAAIWLRALNWCRSNPGKSPHSFQEGEDLILLFEEEIGGQYLCSEICGRQFESAEDHTEYISCGGCERLIDVLANSLG